MRIPLVLFCQFFCGFYFSQSYQDCENELWYSWGNSNGHVMCHLYIDKIDSNFTFVVRDDLWMDEIKGSYIISDDTISFLKNRIIDFGVIADPKVIEGVYSGFENEFGLNIKSSEGSCLKGYHIQKDSSSNSILLYLEDSLVLNYPIIDPGTNYLDVIIPFNFTNILGSTHFVSGFFSNDNIILNGFLFKKTNCIEKPKDKKCWLRRK